MFKRYAIVMVEYLRDLGITLVYATLAGLCIVAIARSDGAPLSLLTCAGYGGFLPAAVFGMIGFDAALQTIAEWRAGRQAVRAATSAN